MDVRLPDGTVIQNVPEGTTKAQLLEKLRATGYQGGLEAAVPSDKLPEVPGATADKGGKGAGFVMGLRDAVDAASQMGVRMASGHPLIGRLLPQDAVAQVDQDVQQRNQVYDASRKLAGRDEGFDWSRIGGNVANPINYFGGAAVQGARTLPQLARAGATLGTVGGLLQPVTDGSDFGAAKTQQAATGLVGGGVLTPPLARFATGTGNLVTGALARIRAANMQRLQQAAEQNITQWAQANGVDLAGIAPGILASARDQVAQALRTGRQLDPAAVIREAEFRALNMQGTQGQITRDPAQFSRERNLMSVENAGEPLRQRVAEQNRQLAAALEQRAQGALEPDIAGERIAGSLRALDDQAARRVGSMYDAAEAVNGGQIALDGAGFVNRATQGLDAAMRGDFLPAQVQSVMQRIMARAQQGVPMTVADAEQLRTILAASSRAAANDGNARHAISIVRDALEATQPVALRGEQATAAYAAARQAHGARMAEREAVPALGAAVADVSPDRFVQRYVIGADARDVTRLVQTLGQQDAAAVDQVRAQVAEFLRSKAVGVNAAGDATFAQASFNKALQQIGTTKLRAIFGPDGAAELQRIGRVAAYVQAHPAGATVNTSNTAGALMNLLQQWVPGGGLVSGAVSIARNAARTAGNERAARQALQGGVPSLPPEMSTDTQNLLRRYLIGPAAIGAGAAAGSDQ